MKKYLLGLFAVVLAVGFSAFTPSQETSINKTSTLFWYQLDANGDLAVDLQFSNPTIPIDQSAAQSNAGCENTPLKPICSFGYEYQIDVSAPVTPPTDHVGSFRKTE